MSEIIPNNRKRLMVQPPNGKDKTTFLLLRVLPNVMNHWPLKRTCLTRSCTHRILTNPDFSSLETPYQIDYKNNLKGKGK